MTETVPKISIPDHHVEFCRAIAAVCKTFNVDNVSMSFRPGWKDPWSDTISMKWDQGRHGEDREILHISSSMHVTTRIDGEEPQRRR
jgi:hypothetical protein